MPPLSVWERWLALLLLSVLGLVVGPHPALPGHARQPEAAQSSPVLPELRPLQSAVPGVQGALAQAEEPPRVPRRRWDAHERRVQGRSAVHPTDLLVLGRMNLDPG